MEKNKLSLDNVCAGAAAEVFERELEVVLKNINDVSCDAKGERAITLKFVFKPFEDRSGAAVFLQCNSKVVAVLPTASTIFITEEAGALHAFPHNIKQEILFDPKEKNNVRPIK